MYRPTSNELENHISTLTQWQRIYVESTTLNQYKQFIGLIIFCENSEM